VQEVEVSIAAKTDDFLPRAAKLHGAKLRELGIESFDGKAELPPEYAQLIREVVRVQCDVESVLMFEDLLRPLLELAPTPLDKMRMAKLHAEEFYHGYTFWKIYRDLDRELTWEDFFGEGQTRKAQYVFSYSYDTWADIAILNTLTDRMGAFVFKDMEDCSYVPWRRISQAVAKDEVGHCSLGYMNLKRLCQDPVQREEVQHLLYKWYPAALDMFGRSDSERQWEYIAWGIKRSPNEVLRQGWIAEVNPLLTALGLEPPDPLYNRRYL
jgi:ring-1,2-phenylacetyl-CoA epoxidase subunit PaaA